MDTPDVTLFGSKASSLIFESYDGGRDSKERLTQVKKRLKQFGNSLTIDAGLALLKKGGNNLFTVGKGGVSKLVSNERSCLRVHSHTF